MVTCLQCGFQPTVCLQPLNHTALYGFAVVAYVDNFLLVAHLSVVGQGQSGF